MRNFIIIFLIFLVPGIALFVWANTFPPMDGLLWFIIGFCLLIIAGILGLIVIGIFLHRKFKR
jgi:hypothetical protein